jgi:cyclopropane-fatty-acyl-phospholipid synthase
MTEEQTTARDGQGKGRNLTENLLGRAVEWAEEGRLPDALIRVGIRRLVARRVREAAAPEASPHHFARVMKAGPIAPIPDKPNEQHYELPVAFFARVLGPHLKYSSGFWPPEVKTLDEAESRALAVTAQRALLEDGQEILELGCGWGSLTLWMARAFPDSHITAVTNARAQKAFIEKRASDRGLTNVRIVAADMNDFHVADRFHRVVSVEMFEHMRNYELLLKRIAGWMRDDGRLFLHFFCHRNRAYPFETGGTADWMGRHFFTGGIMPSADLLDQFRDDLVVEERWSWSGLHYQRTLEAWLEEMDAARDELMPVFASTYGSENAARWFQRWRIFFMACSELFGYREGKEWMVGHYRLRKK